MPASPFTEFTAPLVLEKIYPRLLEAGKLTPPQQEAALRSLALGGAATDSDSLAHLCDDPMKPATPALRPKDPLFVASEVLLVKVVSRFLHSRPR